MRISDWSSDVCSSDLEVGALLREQQLERGGLVGVRRAVDSGEADQLERIADACGVQHEHPNRDRDFIFREFREIFADIVVERQLFLLDQLGRGERGELLRDRGRIKESVTIERSEEHTSELQSLMRISYAVFCLKK